MPEKPMALLVMDSRTLADQADQFDASRIERLGALVDLGSPAWTDSLDTPELWSRLVELLVTSWGVPRLTGERLVDTAALESECAGGRLLAALDELEGWLGGRQVLAQVWSSDLEYSA